MMGKTVYIKENFTSLYFPSVTDCHKESVCLIHLRTEPGFKLNVTLSQFVYQGEANTETCSFAGVWILDKTNDPNTTRQVIFYNCVKDYYDSFYKIDCFWRS